jgi:transcriptional regulator of acetoin/glycerol metabolism
MESMYAIRPRATLRPCAPGLVAVFSRGHAALTPYPLVDGELVLGRSAFLADGRVSRAHAHVSYADGAWEIEDLESRNGTWIDGRRLDVVRRAQMRVLRMGDTLFVPSADALAHDPARMGDAVVGSALALARGQIAEHARRSRTIEIVGEPGSGREHAARYFHASGPYAGGPFVRVEARAITARALHAAQGGVLYVAGSHRLERSVRAELVAATECGIVFGVDAGGPVEVALRSVRLPPLRERIEEIPWHIEREVRGEMWIDASFVEACMLREWRDNVRGLRAAVRRAVADAKLRGATELTRACLTDDTVPERPRLEDDRAAILEALRDHRGDLSRTARALGMHKNELASAMVLLRISDTDE